MANTSEAIRSTLIEWLEQTPHWESHGPRVSVCKDPQISLHLKNLESALVRRLTYTQKTALITLENGHSGVIFRIEDKALLRLFDNDQKTQAYILDVRENAKVDGNDAEPGTLINLKPEGTIFRGFQLLYEGHKR